MKQRLLLTVLLSLTFGAPRAFAGEPPLTRVRPGAVATALVSFAAPAADEAARFAIEPTSGVRILGPSSGSVAAGGGAVRRIPVTFTVPADAPAGAMVAGTVTLEWASGLTERQELRIEVEVVHKLVLSATASQPVIQPGGVVRVTYQLTNLGNAVDTVHLEVQAGAPWTASPPSESRVVAAGVSIKGNFEIRAPRTAPMGEQRMTQIRAIGRGEEQKASLLLLVAEADGGAFGLAQLPVQVFLGSSTAGGTNLSLSGSGAIGPRTEIDIAFRHVGSFSGQIYGQTDLWGPRALLAVRHGGLRAELGDVSMRNDGLAAGIMTAGAGAQVRQQGKTVSGGVMLARTHSVPGAGPNGHLLHGDLGYSGFGGGILTARVLDLEPARSGLLSSGRLQVLGLGYKRERNGAHRLSVEAGLIRQGVGQPGETQGAAVDATYAYSTPGISVSAHVRRVPDQQIGAPLLGNETSVSGSAAILPALRLNASGYWAARTPVGDQPADRTLGATTGIQMHAGASSLGLSWSTREYEGAFSLGGREQRNSLAASVSTGLGPLSLLANAEAGVVIRGDAEPYPVQRMQGQLRWARRSKSAWVSINHTDERLFRSPLQAELGTQLRLGEINFDAAVGANLTDLQPTVAYLHAGAAVYLSRVLSLVAGTEYRPWNVSGSPWTFSLGIRRAVAVPLPLREMPRVSGTVFEDRNGNGRQDPGEPGIGGIAISIGPLKAVTQSNGRFAFRRMVPEGLPVQMDVGSLGEGYLALFSETLVPASGRIEMPVVRASSLQITIFEDRDGDLSRTDGEPPLSGVTVVLKALTGREYPRSTDAAGSSMFSALPPGRYEMYLLRNEKEHAAGPVELAPGEHTVREIGMATEARQIKMLGDEPNPAQK